MWFRTVGIYAFRVGRRKLNQRGDRTINYSVKDNKERAGFKKEVASNGIECWEVVEDVAVRGHQRLISEQVHLEKCCDYFCHLNWNVSIMQEAVPLLRAGRLPMRTSL